VVWACLTSGWKRVDSNNDCKYIIKVYGKILRGRTRGLEEEPGRSWYTVQGKRIVGNIHEGTRQVIWTDSTTLIGFRVQRFCEAKMETVLNNIFSNKVSLKMKKYLLKYLNNNFTQVLQKKSFLITNYRYLLNILLFMQMCNYILKQYNPADWRLFSK